MGWSNLTDILNTAVTDTFESVAVVSGNEVRGTFHQYHNDIDLTAAGISGDQPYFECKEQLAQEAGMVFGLTITIDSTNYKIVRVEPDKQGWIVFGLEEL
jgi:hypothetical protein